MKIVDVQVMPFRIPLKKPTEWARGSMDAAEWSRVFRRRW